MHNKYLTVTALTKYIKHKLETDAHLRNVWLKGEISNFKHHSRGHMYLTIKDDQTRIQAVMFASDNRYLKFRPEDGMHVLIKGEVGVFEPYGQYQLYIRHMEPDGIGSLYLAFEQLKEKLQEQGYFDKSHKKELPSFPKHIGVITSPTGAAIRDIITTIKRRYPIVATTVLPVLVQGPNAADSIKRAIEWANQKGDFDLLIVGRGGGSIEELWAFNEEKTAKAIFHSAIPIISAVGHETDVTISDFVADLRAPTPTGAAELAVPSRFELLDKIQTLVRTMSRSLQLIMKNYTDALNRIKQSFAFRYPEQLINQKEQELDRYVERLKQSMSMRMEQKEEALAHLNMRLFSQHPKRQIELVRKELDNFSKQIDAQMQQLIDSKYNQLMANVDKLTLLNPLEVMKRGYAIPYTKDGTIIHSTEQVNQHDVIAINLADGKIDCQVLSVEEENS